MFTQTPSSSVLLSFAQATLEAALIGAAFLVLIVGVFVFKRMRYSFSQTNANLEIFADNVLFESDDEIEDRLEETFKSDNEQKVHWWDDYDSFVAGHYTTSSNIFDFEDYDTFDPNSYFYYEFA